MPARGKIPVTLSVDRANWPKFRALCISEGRTASGEFDALMKKRLEKQNGEQKRDDNR